MKIKTRADYVVYTEIMYKLFEIAGYSKMNVDEKFSGRIILMGESIQMW